MPIELNGITGTSGTLGSIGRGIKTAATGGADANAFAESLNKLVENVDKTATEANVAVTERLARCDAGIRIRGGRAGAVTRGDPVTEDLELGDRRPRWNLRPVAAEGDLDLRGTLGVGTDVPVGFQAIRLRFTLDTDADDDRLAVSIPAALLVTRARERGHGETGRQGSRAESHGTGRAHARFNPRGRPR